MTDPGVLSFLEVRLALCQLLQRAYAAPLAPDLAAELAQVARVYTAVLDLPAAEIAPWDPEQDPPEYHRLFVGPGPLVAAPYESAHRTPDGLLMQGPAREVAAIYRSFGLTPAATSEPPDHIALELEFYGSLQARMLQALGSDDLPEATRLLQAQQRFYTDHLRQWVLTFCQQMMEGTRSPFYRSLAALTRRALHADKDALQAVAAALTEKKEVLV